MIEVLCCKRCHKNIIWRYLPRGEPTTASHTGLCDDCKSIMKKEIREKGNVRKSRALRRIGNILDADV